MLSLKGINKKKLIFNIISMLSFTLIILSSFNINLECCVKQCLDFIQIDANLKAILFKHFFMFSSIANLDLIVSSLIILFNMLFTITSLCALVIYFNVNNYGIVEKVEYKNSNSYAQIINFTSNDVYLVKGQLLC
ncbi:MAG: hypothetical protein ACI4PF_01190 [Christensenellales bacterium]